MSNLSYAKIHETKQYEKVIFLSVDRKISKTNRGISYLPFSKKIKCFFNFFLCNNLVNVDISYFCKKRYIDFIVAILFIVVHIFNEFRIIVAGNRKHTIVFTNETNSLS